MAAQPNGAASSRVGSIPLLDASSLPGADDWALLESIAAFADGDAEPDGDRLGCVRVAASLDE